MNDKQQAFIDNLTGDGWEVRAIHTTPGVVQDAQGIDVAEDDAAGPIRAVVLKERWDSAAQRSVNVERRYDIGEDGSGIEVPLTAEFGPHENPELSG